MKKHKVYAAFRLSYASHRAFLMGVAKYLHGHPSWQVTVAQDFNDFSDELITDIAAEGYDGIITVTPHRPEACAALRKCSLPMVVVSACPEDIPGRAVVTTFLQGNPLELGREALRFFLQLGKFASYAYLDSPITARWARERLNGFLAAARKENIPVTIIRTPFTPGSPSDLKGIRASLLGLPRPIAVLATYDSRAIDLLLACDCPQLSVPKNVAVLGVDNDQILCNFSNPPLSSISTGQELRGERAAQELQRMFTSKRRRGIRNIPISEYRIVERGTTAPTSTSAHLVEAAMEFIKANACAGISVSDVSSGLHVSRSLLTRLFHDFTDSTVKAEINAIRLQTLKKLLRTTDMPIGRISSLAGFPEPNYAKRFFRLAVGRSMCEYRKSGK